MSADIYAQLPAGYALTRENEAALQALFAGNPAPTADQILAAVSAVDGPQPVAPTALPRLATEPQPRLMGLL